MITTTLTCDICKRPIPKNTLFLQITKQTGNDIKTMRQVCFKCIYRIAEDEVKKSYKGIPSQINKLSEIANIPNNYKGAWPNPNDK